MTEKERLNGITESIIGAAIQVHKALGPGLLESAYQHCLAHEVTKRNLHVEQQKPLPLVYEQVKLECGYRIDLVVEGAVVVEIKSVDELRPSTGPKSSRTSSYRVASWDCSLISMSRR